MADKKISQLTGAVTPLAGTEVLPLVQSGATLKVTAENIFTTTQPSGNANGIVYLNGSKQATTSASFFYNGSNLGINTSTATAIFGKTIQIGNGATNNTIYMVGSGGGSGFLANVGTVFNLTGRGTTTLAFGTNDADRVTIDLSGNTTLLMGNLVVGTAGKGIDFSANTHAAGMTSELLNDYEEGTWTATISDGTTDATMNAGRQTGTYTKVGRQVTVVLYVATTSMTGVTGNLRIKGLPFTAGNNVVGGGAVGYCDGSMTFSSGQVMTLQTQNGADYIVIRYWNGASGTVNMTGAQWGAIGEIGFTLTYFV